MQVGLRSGIYQRIFKPYFKPLQVNNQATSYVYSFDLRNKLSELPCDIVRLKEIINFNCLHWVKRTIKEIESRDIILFQGFFEKVIVLSFTAYGFKICILCNH